MKINLKLCSLVLCALAAAPRLQAGLPPIQLTGYVDVDAFGASSGFSTPVGTPLPLLNAEQNALAISTETGANSDYFGGVPFYSTVVVDLNGDGVSDILVRRADGTYGLTVPPVFNPIIILTGGAHGAFPTTRLAVDNGYNLIIGATYNDGDNNSGTVFQSHFDGSSFTTLSFPASPNGFGANAVCVDSAHEVIVTGASGGPLGFGELTIYPGGLTSGNAPIKHDLDEWAEGNDPVGTPVAGPGFSPPLGQAGAKPKLVTLIPFYGVTFFGGTNGNGPGTSGYGTVYKINNDGSGFQTLHVFSSQRATNGYGPASGMALSGSTLYGATSGGGKYGSGTLFKLDTSGSNFMVFKNFSAYGVDAAFNYTNSDGMAPEGDLLLVGDTLYGTTLEGGTNGGGGVVYSINTNGSNFTVLHSFSNPVNNGSGVYTNLSGGGTRAGVALSGHVLFGTTPYGGPYGGGTLFAIILPSPPSLKIAPAGGQLAVSWRSSATNFVLQQNLTLNSLTWSNFTGAVTDNGTNKSVNVVPAASKTFFRLINTNSP